MLLAKMKIYYIAGMRIRMGNFSFLDLSWEKFRSFEESEVIFEVNCTWEPIVFRGIEWIKYDKGCQLLIRNNDIVVVSDAWKNCTIIKYDSHRNIEIILFQIISVHAVKKHILIFHSSLIEYHNYGLMFLGPSGIGKTTQAELWNKYRDALIINGDIVFVQETEDAFLGWGTPWHGSSPYCENTSVPVHAMIVLKQAPENSIRELTGFEKVSEVSNSVFYPRWLENGMELCLETLDHLLSKIPVYELSCRPDEDAVRLVEETVFK